MADFATLKSKIVTIIQNETDLDSESVFGYEPNIGDPLQDPFAIVIPSGNENEYITTSENRRTYAFMVRLFCEVSNRGKEATETLLTEMVDSVIDALDQDWNLTGSALLMTASPSAWGYIEADRIYRTADIKLLVKTDFSVV